MSQQRGEKDKHPEPEPNEENTENITDDEADEHYANIMSHTYENNQADNESTQAQKGSESDISEADTVILNDNDDSDNSDDTEDIPLVIRDETNNSIFRLPNVNPERITPFAAGPITERDLQKALMNPGIRTVLLQPEQETNQPEPKKRGRPKKVQDAANQEQPEVKKKVRTRKLPEPIDWTKVRRSNRLQQKHEPAPKRRLIETHDEENYEDTNDTPENVQTQEPLAATNLDYQSPQEQNRRRTSTPRQVRFTEEPEETHTIVRPEPRQPGPSAFQPVEETAYEKMKRDKRYEWHQSPNFPYDCMAMATQFARKYVPTPLYRMPEGNTQSRQLQSPMASANISIETINFDPILQQYVAKTMQQTVSSSRATSPAIKILTRALDQNPQEIKTPSREATVTVQTSPVIKTPIYQRQPYQGTNPFYNLIHTGLNNLEQNRSTSQQDNEDSQSDSDSDTELMVTARSHIDNTIYHTPNTLQDSVQETPPRPTIETPQYNAQLQELFNEQHSQTPKKFPKISPIPQNIRTTRGYTSPVARKTNTSNSSDKENIYRPQTPPTPAPRNIEALIAAAQYLQPSPRPDQAGNNTIIDKYTQTTPPRMFNKNTQTSPPPPPPEPDTSSDEDDDDSPDPDSSNDEEHKHYYKEIHTKHSHKPSMKNQQELTINLMCTPKPNKQQDQLHICTKPAPVERYPRIPVQLRDKSIFQLINQAQHSQPIGLYPTKQIKHTPEIHTVTVDNLDEYEDTILNEETEGRRVTTLKQRLSTLRQNRKVHELALQALEISNEGKYNKPGLHPEIKKIMLTHIYTIDALDKHIENHESAITKAITAQDKHKTKLEIPPDSGVHQTILHKELRAVVPKIDIVNHVSNFALAYDQLVTYGKQKNYDHMNYKQALRAMLNNIDMIHNFKKIEHLPLAEIISQFQDQYVISRTINDYNNELDTFYRKQGESIRAMFSRFNQLLYNTEDLYPDHQKVTRKEFAIEQLLMNTTGPITSAYLRTMKMRAQKYGSPIPARQYLDTAEDQESINHDAPRNPVFYRSHATQQIHNVVLETQDTNQKIQNTLMQLAQGQPQNKQQEQPQYIIQQFQAPPEQQLTGANTIPIQNTGTIPRGRPICRKCGNDDPNHKWKTCNGPDTLPAQSHVQQDSRHNINNGNNTETQRQCRTCLSTVPHDWSTCDGTPPPPNKPRKTCSKCNGTHFHDWRICTGQLQNTNSQTNTCSKCHGTHFHDWRRCTGRTPRPQQNTPRTDTTPLTRDGKQKLACPGCRGLHHHDWQICMQALQLAAQLTLPSNDNPITKQQLFAMNPTCRYCGSQAVHDWTQCEIRDQALNQQARAP